MADTASRNKRRGAWFRQHGAKIAHRTWLGAWWHAFRLNRLRRNRPPEWEPYYPREPYPCTWGPRFQDGPHAAPRHWHVGRPPRRTTA